jgi:hypothetical protein
MGVAMFSRTSAVKRVLILMVIGLCAACSKSEKKPAPGAPVYPAKISVVDGVTTVMNPDYPRDGRVTYDMIEEISIGTNEGDERYLLSSPMGVKTAENGDIYILDWADVNIRVYDKDGRFLRTVGRKGQGPGDFNIPCYFCLLPDGTLCILDSANQKLSVLDGQGRFLRGFPLAGYCREVEADPGNELVFLEEKFPPRNVFGKSGLIQMTNRFFRADPDKGTLSELFEFKGEQMFVIPKEGGSNGWFDSCWSVRKKGGISIGYNETYEIWDFSPSGKPRFKYGRAFVPIKWKPKMRDPKNPDFAFFSERDKYGPKNEPVFSSFLIDDNDNLWVELTPMNSKEARIYDVFTPEGVYSRQVKTEHPISLFKNGRAYSIIYSRDGGYPSVKRFRLEENKKT